MGNKDYVPFRMYRKTRDKLKYTLLPLLQNAGRKEDDLTMIQVVDDLVDKEIDTLGEGDNEHV